jgi:hypothetical protein
LKLSDQPVGAYQARSWVVRCTKVHSRCKTRSARFHQIPESMIRSQS